MNDEKIITLVPKIANADEAPEKPYQWISADVIAGLRRLADEAEQGLVINVIAVAKYDDDTHAHIIDFDDPWEAIGSMEFAKSRVIGMLS
jgi:hypothetical protein